MPRALSIFFFFLIILIPTSSRAEDTGNSVSLFLDEATIKRGYTVQNQDFKMALLPGVVKEPVWITLEQVEMDKKKASSRGLLVGLEEQDLNKEETALPVYKFDLKGKVHPETPIKLEKPLLLSLKYNSTNYQEKIIHFWDAIWKIWRPLSSSKTNLEKREVRAWIHLPFSQVALFDSPNSQVGLASWYPTNFTPRNPIGAASNDFKKGSRVRVTNLQDKKFVDVEIVSVGPFVEGRIIDLTYLAFSRIANPREGVMAVKVERL